VVRDLQWQSWRYELRIHDLWSVHGYSAGAWQLLPAEYAIPTSAWTTSADYSTTLSLLNATHVARFIGQIYCGARRQFRRRSPPRLNLQINIRECLARKFIGQPDKSVAWRGVTWRCVNTSVGNIPNPDHADLGTVYRRRPAQSNPGDNSPNKCSGDLDCSIGIRNQANNGGAGSNNTAHWLERQPLLPASKGLQL